MIQVQLAQLANLNEPHLSELREAAARCHSKRLEKEQRILGDVRRDGVVKTVADITNLLSSVTTRAARRKLLKTQIQHKRSQFPEFSQLNKQWFAFSGNRQQLTVQELSTNLEAIVTSCEKRAQHQTAHQYQPKDLPDGADQPQDLHSDSAPGFSKTIPDSDSDDGRTPELLDGDSLLSEVVDFEKGAIVVVAFLDRWYTLASLPTSLKRKMPKCPFFIQCAVVPCAVCSAGHTKQTIKMSKSEWYCARGYNLLLKERLY